MLNKIFSFLISVIVELIFGRRTSSVLIELKSHEGQKLLAHSTCRRNYELLHHNLEEQNELNYCGIASVVTVLNALSSKDKLKYGFNYTQEKVFEEKIKPNVLWQKFFPGLKLEQLEQLFESYSFLEAKTYFADELASVEQFRNLVLLHLSQSESFIIVNYWRAFLGQTGWGHISPLGAYNSEVDSILILDVAGYKYSPVWVDVETLYSAINTSDFISGKLRGLVVVNRK